MLYVSRQDLHTIGRIAGDALAGGPEIEQRQVHQRKADRGDHAGDHRIAGHQCRFRYATVTDRRGDHDAEHQRAEGVHGQVTVEESLEQRAGAIAFGRLSDRAGRCEQRGTTKDQQCGQQHRRDELADPVDQPSGVQYQQQDRQEEQRGVDEQRARRITGKGCDPHFERHRCGAWCREQRADRQIDGDS